MAYPVPLCLVLFATQADYRHPYLISPNDPNRTALGITAFNSRKLSGVFVAGPGAACACVLCRIALHGFSMGGRHP